MKSSFLCSYIIPFIYSPHNLKVLKRGIQVLNKNPNIEIIVIETGKHSFLKDLDIKAKHIFVESELWNLAWLYNIGGKYATTDKIIFGEFSLLPNITFVQNMIGNNTHDCVVGQNKIIYLDENESRSFNYSDKEGTDDKVNGIYYYTRKAFIAIGYFDENLFGKDMLIFQNKKHDYINTGLAETKTYKHVVDNIIEKDSSKHLDKIIKLPKEQLEHYFKGQSKKFCNRHKYEIDKTLEYTV